MPILSIEAFQHKKEITDVPAPRYKIVPNKAGVHSMAATCCFSINQAGNKNKLPAAKTVNKYA